MEPAADLCAGTFLENALAFTLASPAAGAAYRVLVSVPVSAAANPDRRYPLLLVLDGCMDFGTAVETARIQGMTGTAKELIVVGVSAEGTLAGHNLRRLRDYTPPGMRADDPAWTGSAIGQVLTRRFAAAGLSVEQALGGAPAFQTCLVDELLPLLLGRFPIDPDDLGLAGHSAGGVFASYALLTGAPFHKLILGSFSLEMYGETLPHLERAFTERHLQPARLVFAAVGGLELADPLVSAGFQAGQALLSRLQAAAPAAIHVTLHTFPDETHGSTLAHLLSSGISRLWPSGLSYMEALPARMR